MDGTVHEILQSKHFRDGVEKLADKLGDTRKNVHSLAERAFSEMVTCHDPLAGSAYKVLGGLLSRRYRIDVDHDGLRRLRKLDKEHAIAWLPSHRSYLDMFYLEQVLQQADIRPSFVLGGDNLAFWPIGPILRRAGVLYIRRTTHDDPVYRFALRTYLGHLINNGQNLCWSIEGGRSRTGKLRPPRYGALRYVVDAVWHSEGPEVMAVPVSVVYDQLAEVAAMTAEALGGSKRPEGIGWLLRFARAQESRNAIVRIDFGEPIKMRECLRELERDPRAKGQEVERLALQVCHRINRVTPAVPTAIVTLALLGAERALTLDETIDALEPILAYLRDHPTTPHALGVQPQDPGWVSATLDKLADSGVLKRFTEGEETVWYIAPEQHLVAAFYRNTLIHLLVNRAIAELAMFMAREHASSGDLLESIWNHAISLRQLLKFEFFFASRAEFRDDMLAEVALIDPEWEGRDVAAPVVTDEQLELWFERSRPHLAHLILRPFFDAYRVVADQLAAWPPDRPVIKDRLLQRCLGFGRQQVLQKKLHSAESVTLELFRNALELADHRGLLSGVGRDVRKKRQAFAAHLREVVDDLERLSRTQRQKRTTPPPRGTTRTARGSISSTT